MTNEIKQKLKEKAKVYKKYVKNNFDPGYKQLFDEKIQQSSHGSAHGCEGKIL